MAQISLEFICQLQTTIEYIRVFTYFDSKSPMVLSTTSIFL